MSVAVGGLEGILPLDKPVGPTSHDMVARVRRVLGIRRVGHTGTLDPFASGVLLMCIGRSTRLAEYLGGFPKEYLATARLGVSTTTDDVEGEVSSSSEMWRDLDEILIAEALRGFEGDSLQRPPPYSAKKVKGEAAYARARRGEEVVLEPVSVTIHEIGLVRVELPEVEFRVTCSTGTYVRALARDLGARLNVGAHLTALRRMAIGPFRVDRSLPPEALEDLGAVREALIRPLDALGHLPVIEVSQEEARLLQSGQALPYHGAPAVEDAGEMAVAFGSHLLAVAVREGDRLRPRKVFSLG